MHTQYHLYIARTKADELHRAAALSRLAAGSRREQLRGSRCYVAISRRVLALRGA